MLLGSYIRGRAVHRLAWSGSPHAHPWQKVLAYRQLRARPYQAHGMPLLPCPDKDDTLVVLLAGCVNGTPVPPPLLYPARWLDGYQQFVGLPYEPGAALVVDVRYLVPASGGSAPAGWTLLPLFERGGRWVGRARGAALRVWCWLPVQLGAWGWLAWGTCIWYGMQSLGPAPHAPQPLRCRRTCMLPPCPPHTPRSFVASGAYQLPLFQGVPSASLLAEVAAAGSVSEVMATHIQNGHIRPSLDTSSVFVRLMDASRQGQMGPPACGLPPGELRLPGYAACLGAKWLAGMRKLTKNKTYSMVGCSAQYIYQVGQPGRPWRALCRTWVCTPPGRLSPPPLPLLSRTHTHTHTPAHSLPPPRPLCCRPSPKT